jgi:hypothetical protein
LVAFGLTDKMQPGFHPFDIGAGLVRAAGESRFPPCVVMFVDRKCA